MKRHKYEAILFDLDGTLTEPKEGIVNGVHYALSKMGIYEKDKEKLVAFIGPSLYESFSKFYGFSTDDAKKCVEYYRDYYSEKGINENLLMPGMDTLLDSLKKEGRKLYVATGKPTVYAEIVLKNFDLHKYFEIVIGSNLDGSRIEKGEIIAEVLKNTNCKSPVMIGDREHDIIGANENNIDSIAVTFGYGTRDVLEKYNPTYIVDSVNEIRDIL